MKLFLLFLPLALIACATTGYFSSPKLESVYDGDTFTVSLPCKQAVFCKSISVRVRGVDTPEMKGGSEKSKERAKQAKDFTQDFLSKGKIILENCGRDKYFRLLCDVKVNEKSLAEELIKEGHAVPYNGGTKTL